jgi:hypothetical protein
MTGLDNAGMHWADRDLVQALAFDRQERIRLAGASIRLHVAQWPALAPAAMVEPRAVHRQRLAALRPKRSRIARSSRIADG